MGTERFYQSAAWLDVRSQAVSRDNGRCTVAQLLGGTCNGRIHVHHIVPRSERPDLELDLDNLGSACAKHHPMWEAVRKFISKQRAKSLNAELDREARKAAALAEAQRLAEQGGDSLTFSFALDEIERRYRIMFRWLERDDLRSRLLGDAVT